MNPPPSPHFPHHPFYTRYNDTLQAFTVFADQDYNAGDAVEVSYGRKSSGDLLEQYGFLLPGRRNPHDVLAMMPSSILPLLSKDALRADKHTLLRIHGLLLTKDDGAVTPRSSGSSSSSSSSSSRSSSSTRSSTRSSKDDREEDKGGMLPSAPWGRLSHTGHVGGRFMAALRVRSLSLSDLSALGAEPYGFSRLVRALRLNRWYAHHSNYRPVSNGGGDADPATSRFEKPVTVDNERRSRLALVTHCEGVLKGFNTSIAADVVDVLTVSAAMAAYEEEEDGGIHKKEGGNVDGNEGGGKKEGGTEDEQGEEQMDTKIKEMVALRVARDLLRLRIRMKRLLHACVLHQFETLSNLYLQFMTVHATRYYTKPVRWEAGWVNRISGCESSRNGGRRSTVCVTWPTEIVVVLVLVM